MSLKLNKSHNSNLIIDRYYKLLRFVVKYRLQFSFTLRYSPSHNMIRLKENSVKPCFRWAGGKSWLIKYLEPLLRDKTFNNYHEPFLGGAAVFLSLSFTNKAFLSDLNPELINAYIVLRDSPSKLINILSTYENTAEFYYSLRELSLKTKLKRAARFVYLNQTSYNGIYRVNLQGKYNVPYGYRKKDFLDKDILLSVSNALQNTSIECRDFNIVRERIKKNDLVFLDPPYTVSHNNNGFIKYNQKIFSLEDQYRLNELIKHIKRKGAFYILTNAAHKTIKEIFNNGDRCIELNRASLIGGKNAKRGSTSEYVFTNIQDSYIELKKD